MKTTPSLTIIDIAPIPQSDAIVVLAEVIGSSPGIGMRFEDSSHNAQWEIVGFGSGPPSDASSFQRLNLMLRQIKGKESLSSGCILTGSVD